MRILATIAALLAAVFCVYAIQWSGRIATADLAASANTREGFARAIQLAPDDPELRMKEALFRANAEDSTDADQDLRLAAKMNPLDSELMMTMGLRDEFQGNNAGAEAELRKAVEVDHQFKPAWTLANFYFRRQEPEKSLPLLEKVLNLEPLGFDTDPVFALIWTELEGKDETATSRKVLEIVPDRGERRIQYLGYLVRAGKADAAVDAWPVVLKSFDAKDAGEDEIAINFDDLLVKQRKIDAAVRVWNALVQKGVVKGGQLDVAKGLSIADPEFQFSDDGRAFSWGRAEVPGIYASRISSGMRLEISGNEPENFVLLRVTAPVEPKRLYHLRWSADGSALASPHDPGFVFDVAFDPSETKAWVTCDPMLASEKAQCDFATPEDQNSVQIRLRYTRANGTVRANGVLQLDSVRLERAK